jgi:hypothetical protein
MLRLVAAKSRVVERTRQQRPPPGPPSALLPRRALRVHVGWACVLSARLRSRCACDGMYNGADILLVRDRQLDPTSSSRCHTTRLREHAQLLDHSGICCCTSCWSRGYIRRPRHSSCSVRILQLIAEMASTDAAGSASQSAQYVKLVRYAAAAAAGRRCFCVRFGLQGRPTSLARFHLLTLICARAPSIPLPSPDRSAEKHTFIVEKRVAVVSGMIRTMLSSSKSPLGA